jgi:N-acetylneuraminic acid mutarotase
VLYLFGGAVGVGANRDRPTYDAYAYLPGTPGWVDLARMAIPRAFHAVARLPDGSFLVVGGAGSGGTVSTRQGCTDAIDRFVPGPVALSVTPGSGAWTTIGKLPVGLCQPAVAAPDGRIYVIAGRRREGD